MTAYGWNDQVVEHGYEIRIFLEMTLDVLKHALHDVKTLVCCVIAVFEVSSSFTVFRDMRNIGWPVDGGEMRRLKSRAET